MKRYFVADGCETFEHEKGSLIRFADYQEATQDLLDALEIVQASYTEYTPAVVRNAVDHAILKARGICHLAYKGGELTGEAIELEPECGVDFCEECGNCLYCNGTEPGSNR